MATNVDEAFKRFTQLLPELSSALQEKPNESDTRFKVIDRILIEVLEWPRSAILTEDRAGKGYIDYLLKGKGNNAQLVVEAKRTGLVTPATAQQTKSNPRLNGPVLKPAAAGIDQAFGYASNKGAPYAILTDGSFWLFFRAFRGDGVPPLEGSGVMLPNLQVVRSHFSEFFELGSPTGINSRSNIIWLNRAEGILSAPQEDREAALPSEQAKFVQRSDIAPDARLLFKQFFSRLANVQDKEMLRECFADTAESRHANSDLKKIVEKIINTTTVLETTEGRALQEEIERTIITSTSESVLIVGNKGSGKSTFIDRFFEVILPPTLREQCVVARVDLEKHTGSNEPLLTWSINQIIEQLEKQIYTNDPPQYEDLQGVYHREYQYWANGPHKYLYAESKNEFKKKFGDHMLNARINAPENYVRLLLTRAFFALKRLPCIVFDNTDQFDIATQDSIYQLAHALGAEAPSLSIVPITDRTIWRLSKAGALQSYPARTLYLPPPDVKEVLRKRVSFVKNKLSLEPKAALSYFSKKGFKIGLDNLSTFATAIERVFVETDFVSGFIGRLGNYDIRRMLELAERVFISPEIRIDDVVKSAFGGTTVTADTARTHRAIIRGEYDRFSENENPYVLNMFETDANNPTSPLLAYYLLHLLRHRGSTARSDIDSHHWTVSSVLQYLEACGVDRDAGLKLINRLFEWRLIEEMDPTAKVIDDHSRIALRECGDAHLQMCVNSPAYVREMALVTGLTSKQLVSEIRQLSKAYPAERADQELVSSFLRYLVAKDRIRMQIPAAKEYRTLREARQEFENSIKVPQGPAVRRHKPKPPPKKKPTKHRPHRHSARKKK